MMPCGTGLIFDSDHNIIVVFPHTHKDQLNPASLTLVICSPAETGTFSCSSTMDSSDDSERRPNKTESHTFQYPVAFDSLFQPDHQRGDEGSNKKRKQAAVVGLMDLFPQNKRVCVGGSSRDRVRESEDEAHDTVNTSLNLLTTGNISGRDQSKVDLEKSPKTYDEGSKSENLAALEAAKERLMSENQQLRQSLTQATHYINSLERQLFAMQQQQSTNTYQNNEHNKNASGHQFIDLGLATPHHDKGEASQKEIIIKGSSREVDNNDNSNNVEKPYINNSKGPRNNAGEPPRNARDADIQQAAEATMRKTRVSIRMRTEAAVISDGCQWRKYGQKMAKGSPWPRSYYRCTMATSCPVRKQVQRCGEDRSVLITTYEGNHNHPLPLAAMGMVALTSSATQLLLSGSMPRSEGLVNTDYLRALLPACTNSSSVATISALAPFPSVTIDLTKPPNPLQFPSVPSHGLQIPSVSVPSSRTNHEAAEVLQKIVGELMRNLNQSGPHQTILGNNNQEVERVGAVGGCNDQVRQQKMSSDQPSHDAMNVLMSNPNFAAAFADVIGSINRACVDKGKIIDGARSYTSNDDSNPSDNDGKEHQRTRV